MESRLILTSPRSAKSGKLLKPVAMLCSTATTEIISLSLDIIEALQHFKLTPDQLVSVTTFLAILHDFSKLKNALLDYAKLQEVQLSPENQLEQNFIDRLIERSESLESLYQSLSCYVNGPEKDYKELLNHLPKRSLSDSVVKTLKVSEPDKLAQAAEETLDRNKSKLLKTMADAMKLLESDLIIPVIEEYNNNLPTEKISFYKKGDVAISKFQSFEALNRFETKFNEWFNSMSPMFSGIRVTLELMRVFCSIATTHEKSKEFRGHSEIYSRRDKFMLYHPDNESCIASIKDIHAVLMLNETIFKLVINRVKRGFADATPQQSKPQQTHIRLRSTSCSSFFATRDDKKSEVDSDATKTSTPPNPS